MSTLVLCVTVVAFLGFVCVTWVGFLRVGLKWSGTPRPVTKGQLATATTLCLLANATTLSLARSLELDIPSELAAVVPIILLKCLLIKAVFKISLWQAAKAWLPTLGSTPVVLALSFLVLRPFVLELLQSPANSMAPTLLGKHLTDVCPECGSPCYATDFGDFAGQNPVMICGNFHAREVPNKPEKTGVPDSFVSMKLLTPQRWDVVTFYLPSDPSVLYAKRLVGLPGEEIIIRDGAVYADGTRIEPPPHLAGLSYSSGKLQPGLWHALGSPWGSSDSPAVLGDDEYFVLGDFSDRSMDSRYWERGAPGHNPFAVPADHIHGVVTHTYWPPSRWKVHR